MAKVSVVRVDEFGDLVEAVADVVERSGALDLSGDERVAIKPNLCDLMSSESGATTDPRVAEALVVYLHSLGVEDIAFVESNHWVSDAWTEFDALGYTEVAKRRGVRLINLSEESWEVVELPIEAFRYHTLWVPRTFMEYDVLISLPKLKTHVFEGISGSIKNLYGCIPQRIKSHYHPFLPQILANLCALFKPMLSLVDGIYAMEGAGPTRGSSKRLGLLIAGGDPVAVDSLIALMCGMKPSSVPHLRLAKEAGLGGFVKATDVDGADLRELIGLLKPPPRLLRYSTKLWLGTNKLVQRVGDWVVGVGEALATASDALSSGAVSKRKALAFGFGRLVRVLRRI